MPKYQITSYLLLFSTCLIAQSHLTFEFKNDTLKSKLRFCNNLSYKPQYHKLLNIVVDANYIIIDSVKSKLNNDYVLDYTYVLSNRIQDSSSNYTNCSIKYNRRLILVFISQKNGFAKPIINENIIPNNGESFDTSQSPPFDGIRSEKNGFRLDIHLGKRMYYEYSFYFKSGTNNDLFLYKTKSSAQDMFFPDNNKRQTKYYTQNSRTDLRYTNTRNFVRDYLNPR